jgi:hypothetical protein
MRFRIRHDLCLQSFYATSQETPDFPLNKKITKARAKGPKAKSIATFLHFCSILGKP